MSVAVELIRLQKYLAEHQIASRRKAEELIRDGAVTINGRVAVLGDKVNPETDFVKVGNNRKIPPRSATNQHIPKVYGIFYKPPGYVTTMDDPEGRSHVGDLLAHIKPKVYPVGRLDFNSEGLLFFTNDGYVANRLTHPKYKLPKTYVVKIRGHLSEEHKTKMCRGVRLPDGYQTKPCQINVVENLENGEWLEVQIAEGHNRQIRQMFELFRHYVVKLKRVALGELTLRGLDKGQYRFLSPYEVQVLKDMLQMGNENEQPLAEAAEALSPAEVIMNAVNSAADTDWSQYAE